MTVVDNDNNSYWTDAEWKCKHKFRIHKLKSFRPKHLILPLIGNVNIYFLKFFNNTELKLCCTLCYGMLCNALKNGI